MIRPILAAASAFGLVLAAQGHAATQITVDHSDLDLSTSAGQAELDKRIDKAAKKACTVVAPTGTMMKKLDRDCYEAAVGSVRQNVALAERGPVSGR